MAQETTTALLVRHGRTAFNRDGVFRGRSEVPLDDVGRAQAQATAELLGGLEIAAVYSAPLMRARETAECIAVPHGLPVVIEPAFDNIELGPWTGRPRTRVAQEQPEEWRTWIERPEELRLPGAETLDAVADRAHLRFLDLVERHVGETIVLVSHRAVLKPLLARALAMRRPWFWRFSIDPSSVTVVSWSPDRGAMLVRLNDANHLEGERGNLDDA